MVKIVECPRDAMQGFHSPISTEKKISYLNALLKVGFDVIDCGSFVSSKAVPQLADTAEVLNSIDKSLNGSELLTIVANERGAEIACEFNNVSVIGFPFSISETFQLRNTRQTLSEALIRLKNIKNISESGNKKLLVYLSMGFGNPYNDEWSTDLAGDWCLKLSDLGIQMINLSDTIGAARPQDISTLFASTTAELSHIEFGAHFHTRPDNYLENIRSAYDNGCRKFDAAIKGFGGCPFASDKLTGNLPTEDLLAFLDSIHETNGVDKNAFHLALEHSASVFV
jgi:hydroxymethylglutaryl-CoA lyase